MAAQRRLKPTVWAEQLRRLAGLTWHVEVEPVAGDLEGLGWRTRVSYAVTADGRPGLRRHRSHDVVPVDDCLIAHSRVREMGVTAHQWPGAETVQAVTSGTGENAVMVKESPGTAVQLPSLGADVTVVVGGNRRQEEVHLTEEAAGRQWQVGGGGFWQVHPGAADALVQTVVDGLDPQVGESVLDLYAGVGLFAGALEARVGPTADVVAVEFDARAVASDDVAVAHVPHCRGRLARDRRWGAPPDQALATHPRAAHRGWMAATV
jgi:tRNA/tmRNA/rRNA uracil-C5-methylase (TrmA/RlmC/RlmD family)